MVLERQMDNSKTPIFDRMAVELSSLRPEYRDEILCPMCLGRYGRARIHLLTKEHVLARSLGGRAVTLTCKVCNNTAGHRVQNHLKTLLKLNEGFRGDGELRGRFTIFGETVPVGVTVRPGAGLTITACGGSPRTMGAVEKGFRSHRAGKWSMQVNLPYNPAKASAAIARAAYLVVFQQFGYRYILSESVNLIRQEIISAMDRHSDRLCLLTGKLGPAPAPNGNEPEAVLIPVVLEYGYKFLVVVMRFQQHRDYWMFCALPREAESTESVFENLAKAVHWLGNFNLTISGDEDGEVIAQFVPKSQQPNL
jgi:hypothetical protein